MVEVPWLREGRGRCPGSIVWRALPTQEYKTSLPYRQTEVLTVALTGQPIEQRQSHQGRGWGSLVYSDAKIIVLQKKKRLILPTEVWEPPQGSLSRALKDGEGAYQAVKSLLLFTSAWSIIAPTLQSHRSCSRCSGKVSDIY